MKCETLIIEKGTAVIPLLEVRRCIQALEYADPHRIYMGLLFHSLRPSEPIDLSWSNLFLDQDTLIFRPSKQEKLGHRVLRKIRLSPRFSEELRYYRDHGTFFKGRIFGDLQQATMRKFMNSKLRPMLGRDWLKKSENLRSGKIPQYYKYTFYSFRVTIATLLYKKLWDEYQEKEIALIKTCDFMGHKSEKVTASYYIKRIEDLELHRLPDLPLLELMDYLIYNEIQCRVSKWIEQSSERQSIMTEF